MSAERQCKDCVAEGVTTKRPAPHPGPRCTTHHRAIKRARREAAHTKRVFVTYGLEDGEYLALYEAQGKVCAICQVARGVVKKLAVDHDHAIEHLGKASVRGLLCGPCNQMLGRSGDKPEFFLRAAAYLENPPAQRFFGQEEK